MTPELLQQLAEHGLIGVVAAMGWGVAWQKDREVRRNQREIRQLGEKMLKLAVEQVQANVRLDSTITAMREAVARGAPPPK